MEWYILPDFQVIRNSTFLEFLVPDHNWVVMGHALIHARGSQRQADLSEFEATLVHMASSRPVRTTK